MTPPQFTMPRDMSGFSDLEAAMLAAIHQSGLPEPAIEYRFDGCCPHPKPRHLKRGADRFCADCRRIPDCFHEYRKGRAWRFDFAYPDRMVAIECEGGTWSGGRHTRGSGFAADAEKYNEAALQGWRVLRFTGKQIESGEAIEAIERALECLEAQA